MLSTYNFCTIYSYLSHGDLGKWLCVAKEFPGKNSIEQRIMRERSEIQRRYIEIKNWRCYYFFQNSGFPMRIITQLPILPFQRKFVGGTDYIDGIRSTDLTAPIMVGVDCYKRPFIVISYKCFGDKWISWDGDVRDFWGAGGNKRITLIVFNRYTSEKGGGQWCKAGSGSFSGSPILLGSNTYLNKKYKQLLTKNICELLSGSPVSYINGLEEICRVDCRLINL